MRASTAPLIAEAGFTAFLNPLFVLFSLLHEFLQQYVRIHLVLIELAIDELVDMVPLFKLLLFEPVNVLLVGRRRWLWFFL